MTVTAEKRDRSWIPAAVVAVVVAVAGARLIHLSARAHAAELRAAAESSATQHARDIEKELQALLQRRGYDIGGDPDGHIGTKSKAAIADFQQRAGLEVNGRASVKVLAALKK